MNQDIIKSVLTSVIMSGLGSAATWLIANGIGTQDDWNKLLPGLALLLAGICIGALKALQHRAADKVAGIKSVTGATVVVDMKTAAPKVQALAADPTVTYVQAK